MTTTKAIYTPTLNATAVVDEIIETITFLRKAEISVETVIAYANAEGFAEDAVPDELLYLLGRAVGLLDGASALFGIPVEQVVEIAAQHAESA